MPRGRVDNLRGCDVSVLYREPKLLKFIPSLLCSVRCTPVSVLYREPKLLKSDDPVQLLELFRGFSALP